MCKPIRVLHVFGVMNRGGAETFIMNIYRNLDRKKIQFDFAVESGFQGDYDDEIRQLGGNIYVVSKPDRKNVTKYYFALENILINKGPFAAIHSHVHFFSGIVLAIAKKNNVPIRIAHSHTTKDDRKTSFPRWLYKYTMRKLISFNSTEMVGCSKPSCISLYGGKNVTKGNTRIIPNGIEIKKYNIEEEKIRFIKSKIGISEDAIVFGHIGRFEKVKNHKFILKVFMEIKRKMPKSILLLVGKGNLKGEIETFVKINNLGESVLFLGLRDDIPEIINVFDVFLFPSLYEGLGIVLIEAQAAGIPSICSDTVPLEVDLNLGLLRFISLNCPVEDWCNSILSQINSKKISWTERSKALQNEGYDISKSKTILHSIYLGS